MTTPQMISDEEARLSEDVTQVRTDRVTDRVEVRDRVGFLALVFFYFAFAQTALGIVDAAARGFVVGTVVNSVNLVLLATCLISWLLH